MSVAALLQTKPFALAGSCCSQPHSGMLVENLLSFVLQAPGGGVPPELEEEPEEEPDEDPEEELDELLELDEELLEELEETPPEEPLDDEQVGVVTELSQVVVV